jgi:hypothetical protein
LKPLAELFISAMELVEAEGRDLRRWTFQVGAALAVVLLAAALAAAGVLAVAAAIYLLLSWAMGPIAAWAIVGVLLVGGAGGLWWMAHGMINRRK